MGVGVEGDWALMRGREAKGLAAGMASGFVAGGKTPVQPRSEECQVVTTQAGQPREYTEYTENERSSREYWPAQLVINP
jgi:hypothetical protein